MRGTIPQLAEHFGIKTHEMNTLIKISREKGLKTFKVAGEMPKPPRGRAAKIYETTGIVNFDFRA